jgi:hypothetical protein
VFIFKLSKWTFEQKEHSIARAILKNIKRIRFKISFIFAA